MLTLAEALELFRRVFPDALIRCNGCGRHMPIEGDHNRCARCSGNETPTMKSHRLRRARGQQHQNKNRSKSK